MKIIITLFLVFILNSLQSQEQQIIEPIKNVFFPLEVGNIYVYEVRNRKKVLCYDSTTIVRKFDADNFKGFTFYNKGTYFVKGDSIYIKYPHEQKQSFGYNLLYYPTYKDSEYPYFEGDCTHFQVYSSYLKTYKIGNKIYKNCFKFSFNKDRPNVVIIAYGIGIIQTIENGEFRNLIRVDLK